MSLRPLVLPCLLALAGCGEDAPPATKPPLTALRSEACEGGASALASGQLLLPEDVPAPLAGVKGSVELADDTRSAGGTRRTLLTVRAEGLKDVPLAFALCGSLPTSVDVTAPTLSAWVDLNGNGSLDAGDARLVQPLPLQQSWQELTLTLPRI